MCELVTDKTQTSSSAIALDTLQSIMIPSFFNVMLVDEVGHWIIPFVSFNVSPEISIIPLPSYSGVNKREI